MEPVCTGAENVFSCMLHHPKAPGVRAERVMDMANLQRILEIAKEKRSFFRKMLKKKKKREFKA